MDNKEFHQITQNDYINHVKTRGGNIVCNNPFMSDEDWKQALSIAHKRGPLPLVEGIRFEKELTAFAKGHFIDFVFELELAYAAIAALCSKSK